MRTFTIALFVTLLSSIAFAQHAKFPPELAPSIPTREAAQANFAAAVKLLPRGKYSDEATINPLGVRGGGAYYSFTTQTYSYDKIPQIEFSGTKISTGFAGADYGFIYDLGEVKLADIASDHKAVQFLKTYEPPGGIADIRKEQARRSNYSADGLIFSDSLGAIVGHSYLLRSISFSNADVLVALHVTSVGDDGVEFIWKPMKTFRTPVIADPANDPLSRERESKVSTP